MTAGILVGQVRAAPSHRPALDAKALAQQTLNKHTHAYKQYVYITCVPEAVNLQNDPRMPGHAQLCRSHSWPQRFAPH